MTVTIIRWSVYIASLFVFGPIAGLLMAGLRAPDGAGAGTPLVCTTPAMGLLAGLGVLGIALIPGLISARFVGVRAGMVAAGMTLAWATWRTGTSDELIRSAGSAEILGSLAVEGAIFGVLGIGLALLLAGFGRHEHADHSQDSPTMTAGGSIGHKVTEHIKSLFGGKGTPTAILVAVVVGGGVAWVIAQTPLKGQAVGAACFGALFAAAAGRLAAYQAPLATLAVPVALLAVLGPLSGMVLGAGLGNMLAAGRAGTLFPLANILPLDWVAGGLIGIPFGASWAGSMLDKRIEGGS